MPDSEPITVLQLKDLRVFSPAFPIDRHAGFCIPDLALSANTSFAFVGYSPQELTSPLNGPSSLLTSFVPSLSLKALKAQCLKACSQPRSASMVCQSSPAYPDFDRACLDAITRLVSLSLSLPPSPVPGPYFIPATHLSFEERAPTAFIFLVHDSADADASHSWC